MRLDDYDDSIRVEDQRGRAGGLGGGGGLPFGLLALVGSRFGIGGVIVVVIGLALFGGLGNLLGGGGQSALQSPAGVEGGKTVAESCSVNAFSHESCNALSSLNKTWQPIMAGSFAPPKLVFYSQSGQSGCGAAQSAMGPFYCPSDQGIYIDTDFYTEMDKQMGAGGDFARDYVMAHEYGHHIQALSGVSEQVHQAQQRSPSRANQLSVRLELQADCYAGVWAAANRDRIEPGDMEEGLRAAHQIGDDTLMKAAGRRPVEAAFTHGSSAQRMEWLKKGLDSGDPNACDTFAS
ncbi:KPN_02809 family neutral zinc metallopeptidase [Novosphingobium percolationis]|uniref:KPN_02809 family neutral zinc metallopeptidase n=1 Tax=Novosphingobium percolationis TaxID=2871811 RepID=UPI001CD3AE1E|nr:neutral zinc metallopeptidase [Novosphingobium percolationis]